jgi:hypothetical protein
MACSTDINLLKFMDQLAIELGVSAGNYTTLLNTQGNVTQFIKAAATVVQLNGATATVITALGQLQVAAINAAPVKLGDILQLQTGTTAAGLDANLQLLQLIQGVVQLANSKSAVAATLPISVLGLAGVTVRVKVINRRSSRPLVIRRGPRPIRWGRTDYVRTRRFASLGESAGADRGDRVDQCRIGAGRNLTPTLNALLSLNLVATLNSVGCLLGAGCEQLDPLLLPSPQIDIALDAGGAVSYVTDYSCPAGQGTTGTKA